MLQLGTDLFAAERLQDKLEANTLPQRLENPMGQSFQQFWLSHEHHTDQVDRIQLKIYQQPNFIKNIPMQDQLATSKISTVVQLLQVHID